MEKWFRHWLKYTAGDYSWLQVHGYLIALYIRNMYWNMELNPIFSVQLHISKRISNRMFYDNDFEISLQMETTRTPAAEIVFCAGFNSADAIFFGMWHSSNFHWIFHYIGAHIAKKPPINKVCSVFYWRFQIEMNFEFYEFLIYNWSNRHEKRNFICRKNVHTSIRLV